MSEIAIRRLLVPVDFDGSSEAAMRVAAAVGRTSGAALTVLHAEVLDAPPYFTAAQVAMLERERRAARLMAEAHLRSFARRHGAADVRTIVADGSPAGAILAEAERHDLIVMGTHGRRGAARWWLGSVAERVVRAAAVPVLVVPVEMGDETAVLEQVSRFGPEDVARATEALRKERRPVLFVPGPPSARAL